MDTAQGLALIAATVTTGLVSGLFYGYACSVMLALRGTADRTFIEMMQRINVAILNGWFVLGYVGALLFTVVALGLQLADGWTDAAGPTVAALVCYLAAMAVTSRVNIPLNNALEKAGPPERITEPHTVRRHFEGPWVRWNVVRAVLCSGALVLLCWSLILHGAG
ncbi:anthrone oxygenase family protein [Streptomyces viridosporus]|uniref:anthrone oxygenase family protein n=1 Tax=Streptomyces viridosporus TaxID=67581 RepID=UPI0009C005A9|nr:DUF1772 domain-containing protein [Streptomyces viridosporus]